MALQNSWGRSQKLWGRLWGRWPVNFGGEALKWPCNEKSGIYQSYSNVTMGFRIFLWGSVTVEMIPLSANWQAYCFNDVPTFNLSNEFSCSRFCFLYGPRFFPVNVWTSSRLRGTASMDVCSRVAQTILLRVYSKLLTPLDCLLRSFGRTLNVVKTRSPKVEFRRSPKVVPQTSLPQGFWRPKREKRPSLFPFYLIFGYCWIQFA